MGSKTVNKYILFESSIHLDAAFLESKLVSEYNGQLYLLYKNSLNINILYKTLTIQTKTD